MPLETKHNLNKDTIKKVQDLIQINIDSKKGFAEAAAQIEDVTIGAAFSEFSKQRSEFAEQLQQYVSWSGETPVEEGSYAGAVHRTWLDLRAKLNGGDSLAVLSEAERGEDHIKSAYEDALKATTGSAVSDVLHQQYAIIKNGHDRIRDLRDEYKSE